MEIRSFCSEFMASQQTSLNDLIAKFNIITIFHLLACREMWGWGGAFGWVGVVSGLNSGLEDLWRGTTRGIADPGSGRSDSSDRKNFCNSIKMQIFFRLAAVGCNFWQFSFRFSFLVYIIYFIFRIFSNSQLLLFALLLLLFLLLLCCLASCDSFVKVMTNCERFAFEADKVSHTLSNGSEDTKGSDKAWY